jgi:hypothetical protein
MTVYKVRSKSPSWDGESIGILILDAAYPRIPGNVGNASTFGFPVRYKEVRGASIKRLINRMDPGLLGPFVEAARELEMEGVKAVTGACGFMALFQREVAAALKIPVFLSSLLQVPFIWRTLSPAGKIGIITANSAYLTDRHFEAVGITREIPLVIRGMEDQEEFRSAVLEEKGTLDSRKIEEEVTGVARAMIDDNPETEAILLECSDLPPYAKAVQDVTRRPVFDFITMISHFHTAMVRERYQGFM